MDRVTALTGRLSSAPSRRGSGPSFAEEWSLAGHTQGGPTPRPRGPLPDGRLPTFLFQSQ